MRRFCLLLTLCVAAASAAGAATLTVTPDQAIYTVGQTITLDVAGDSEGGAATTIFGLLLYSAALTDTIGSSQSQHGPAWSLGPINTSDGLAEVFNQTQAAPLLTPTGLVASATLIATAPGTVDVTWDTGTLDYFGLASPPSPAASFTIVAAPEPTTLTLVGLGLVGLVAVRRLR